MIKFWVIGRTVEKANFQYLITVMRKASWTRCGVHNNFFSLGAPKSCFFILQLSLLPLPKGVRILYKVLHIASILVVILNNHNYIWSHPKTCFQVTYLKKNAKILFSGVRTLFPRKCWPLKRAEITNRSIIRKGDWESQYIPLHIIQCLS